MQYRITINLDGAAFEDEDGTHNPAPEVASILERLAREVDAGFTLVTSELVDVNGNTCGRAWVSEDDAEASDTWTF